jgi:hypothetical protein
MKLDENEKKENTKKIFTMFCNKRQCSFFDRTMMMMQKKKMAQY